MAVFERPLFATQFAELKTENEKLKLLLEQEKSRREFIEAAHKALCQHLELIGRLSDIKMTEKQINDLVLELDDEISNELYDEYGVYDDQYFKDRNLKLRNIVKKHLEKSNGR